ncbi:hypothetical protein HDK64DRAFT_25773 [Phyllosticta capitalensis]
MLRVHGVLGLVIRMLAMPHALCRQILKSTYLSSPSVAQHQSSRKCTGALIRANDRTRVQTFDVRLRGQSFHRRSLSP